MLNLLWMVIVGGVIGLVASMFVQGSRSVGMGWTILLGAMGYGVGGWLAQSFGGSTLVQWVLGIAVASLLITGYLILTGRRN